MNRGGRRGGHKPFVIGGVYDISSCSHIQQQSNQKNNVDIKNQQNQQQSAKVKPLIKLTPQMQMKQRQQKPPIQQQMQKQQQEQQQMQQHFQQQEKHLLLQSQQQQQQPQQQKTQQSEQLSNNNSNSNSFITSNAQNIEKNDAVTPMDTDNEKIKSNDAIEPGVDRKTFFSKVFLFRKKSSIRAKEKKIRQNRNLRKVILPKNALMALNEVKGIQIGDFIVNSIGLNGGFSALVTVNQIQYEGKGASKTIAKNNACEKALRDIVISKMQQKPRRINTKTVSEGQEPMDLTESTNTNTNENSETNDSNSSKLSTNDDSDVPMINLASFALYKLFSEWENEGFHIPEFHNGSSIIPAGDKSSVPADKFTKKIPIKTELPENWEALHPATLLCMMRPGLTYCNWGMEGERPNLVQNLSIEVDNQVFVGSGRSKKIARKNAAIAACNKLFGTNFVKEEH